MGVKAGLAALCVAVVVGSSALAQDVTLVAREGGIVLSGTLQGYDGEFYRIDTAYGALTVDGQGVICEGPACPELVAPKAVIRVVGAADAAPLLPALMQAFAQARGLVYEADPNDALAARILDPETRKDLAEVSFQPMAPDAATAAVTSGAADLKLAFNAEPGLSSHSLAMDALVAIVAPDNPTPEISTVDLSRVLTGEVTNWSAIGGPDMPIVLHALKPEADLQQALAARLGQAPVAGVLQSRPCVAGRCRRQGPLGHRDLGPHGDCSGPAAALDRQLRLPDAAHGAGDQGGRLPAGAAGDAVVGQAAASADDARVPRVPAHPCGR